MENLIITGKVSATSNKVDDKYQQESPTKTAYVEVTDPNIVQAMENFGLTQYTSRDNKTDFFIIKCPKQVTLVKGNQMRKMSGGVETPNFKTVDGKEFKMNIIKGNNKGNDFYRLQAILVDDYAEVENIMMENPFGGGYLAEDPEQVETQTQQPVNVSDEDLPF